MRHELLSAVVLEIIVRTDQKNLAATVEHVIKNISNLTSQIRPLELPHTLPGICTRIQGTEHAVLMVLQQRLCLTHTQDTKATRSSDGASATFPFSFTLCT